MELDVLIFVNICLQLLLFLMDGYLLQYEVTLFVSFDEFDMKSALSDMRIATPCF
jgi:hypothetical protein